MINRRQLLIGAGTLGLAPFGLASYAVAVEPMLSPRVTSYALTPPGWPQNLRLRIGVIADIHACEPWMSAERIHGIAMSVNALSPDLIVLLGDFNAGHRLVSGPVFPGQWGDALSVLRAPLGVHAILGNHDWWHGPVPGMPGGAEEVRRALRQVDINLLENNAVSLRHEGQSFWLAGLADQMAHMIGRYDSRGADDLGGTLRSIGDDDPVLLLMHEPFLFPRVPNRVSLTLCGHTHGGQINVPLIGTPFAPSRRYVYGHIVEGGRHMIISGGLGESGAPIRFRVPPEILQIDLGAPLVSS
ncbi:metallophosphoesterase [Lichenihabitans sp. PAMC28606]|uniref:metallophosphoesterase n=1 Tax=Lichenihabitans sp. PAMC28606 TaxID=2880932 RepID=UPI001D0AB33F|nr:metallophosphoesterase [Lichenihabitans sp. PAMC28606]UDL94833.1 metallophosphoesterase [Lichenihabitans sp. PAMC28606]